MGAIRKLVPVKLFIGTLVSDAKLAAEVETRLISAYGPIDHRSPVMGTSIERRLYSFERLIEADQLPEIKRETNRIEEEMLPLLTSVKRPVNLDPGYIEQAKVILASTKNFAHRIYLSKGIFGEITMQYKDNAYQFFPWTLPDYQSEPYLAFFLKQRQIYRSQLQAMCFIKSGG